MRHMKAIIYSAPGDPSVLRYDDAPMPEPAAAELLVRVRATAVNRADLLQRQGAYPPPAGASPILGLEIVGIVEQAAGDWRVGDRVMAVIMGGGYAEYATVPAGMALRVPDAFTDEQAAAIPEAFLTAYLNLFTLGKLTAGETVLIHAGASGVGTAAIQLARAAGARVFATAGSDNKLARCRELGAELAINYRSDSFLRRALEATDARGVDLVLDFIGASYWDDNLAALARGGRLLLIGFLGGTAGQLNIGAIMRKQLTVTGTTLRGMALARKIELTQAFAGFALPRFVSGELQPVIDKIFPLREAAQAHEYMQRNANVGKIILKVG